MNFCTESGILPGIKVSLQEQEINHEATDYIADNYYNILSSLEKFNLDKSKTGDLLDDVWIAIKTREDNGEGYTHIHPKSGMGISVEHYVFGMLKKYAMNIKYHIADINKGGEHKEFSVGTKEVDDERLGGIAYLYEIAPSYDSLEELEEDIDMKDSLNYCLSFESEIGVNIRYLLKNIDEVLLKTTDTALFTNLRKLTATKEEFKEALTSVLMYRKRDILAFNRLVSNI